MTSSQKTSSTLRIIATALAVELVLFAGYRYWALYEEKKTLERRSEMLEVTLRATEEGLRHVQGENAVLDDALATALNEKQLLEGQVTGLAGAVSNLSGEVGTIKKLQAIDPELLKKYSRVYFLSENYAPKELLSINTQYLDSKTTDEYFHTRALPFLHRMLAAATGDGVTIRVRSAYRSFEEQASIKSVNTVIYGSGANQFSADQGYSEHQLGTTCDFTTPGASELTIQFENSAAYKWLTANAYRYGFVLSYPKNNAYYEFEPWHWRFVGTALATALRDQKKNLYDLPQREIDEYLITLFD